MNLKLNLS